VLFRSIEEEAPAQPGASKPGRAGPSFVNAPYSEGRR
jgi:hypothetical protein